MAHLAGQVKDNVTSVDRGLGNHPVLESAVDQLELTIYFLEIEPVPTITGP
jgi:hypothetical protein